MANYTKINLSTQSDLVLTTAEIGAVTGGLRTELDGIILSGSTAVANEEARAKAAELVLTNDLAAEVSRAEGIENNIISDLQSEISRAEEAESVLAGKISDEENRAMAAESGLSSDISAEKSRAMAEESVLAGKISDEENRAMAAELALSNQIADIISNVDPAALDSLTEIVAAFQGADGDLSAAITAALGTHTSELATEIAARIAGDADTLAAAKAYTDALENGTVKANTIAINAEKARAEAAELVLTNNLATEVSDRIAGDATTLASGKTYTDGKVATEKAERIADVNAEQTRAEGAEASLGMDIANETERAMLAESGLQSSIDDLVIDSQNYTDNAVAGEKAERVAADNVLTSDLAAEVSRALGAEGVLTSDLATEVSDRKAADLALKNAIDEEKARAEGVEAGLRTDVNSAQGQIDAILLASDADKDSFAEIVTLINSVDLTNDNALGTAVSNINDSIDAEKARAEAAELVLTNDLATEKTNRIAGDADNYDAIVAEETRALGAELVLTNDLAAEVSRAIAKEGVLSGEILTEKNRAIAAESGLSSDIAAEKTRAMGVEAGLQSSINNLTINAQNYTDNAVAGLKQEVDDSVERILDLDFSVMFAQKIGSTANDDRNYTLDKAVMGMSLQVFENGLLLEEGADYTVEYDGDYAKGVVFGYGIKSDWKVKFFGVPFNSSDVDLIAG